MSDNNDLSYSELRSKEIINSTDGKRLGRIIDIIFSIDTGKIKGIVAPYSKKVFIFKPCQDVFIPWQCVKKIGEDVIIVELVQDNGRLSCRVNNCRENVINTVIPITENIEVNPQCDPQCDSQAVNVPNCDNRCDKCMLFDCAYRWKKQNSNTNFNENSNNTEYEKKYNIIIDNQKYK